MKLRLTCIVVLLFGFSLLQAQNIEYGAALDTTYMLIGDQQHLTFVVKSDQPLKVGFPQLKDTVSRGIEIISGPVRDSSKGKDGKWVFEEKYVITVFDSGVYVVPPMPIVVENESYNNVLRTDPLSFVVNTYQVDEQKGNYDIVAPYKAPWTFAEIRKYLLWGLLGLVVIAAVIWYIVRRRKNRPLFRQEKVAKIPPYVKAIQALDSLKTEKLWQSGKVKEYYTRLTDAVRQYLDEELGIPAMEQTSLETLRAMEGCPKIGSTDRENIATMLETADYVKFAKALPLPDENARNLDRAYEFLNNTDRKLKEEEQKRLEERKKEEAEEQKPEEHKDFK